MDSSLNIRLIFQLQVKKVHRSPRAQQQVDLICIQLSYNVEHISIEVLLSEIKIISKWTLIYGRCSLKWFLNPINVSRVFVLRSIQKLISWLLVAWQQASCIFIVTLPAVINIQMQWHTLSVSMLSCYKTSCIN